MSRNVSSVKRVFEQRSLDSKAAAMKYVAAMQDPWSYISRSPNDLGVPTSVQRVVSRFPLTFALVTGGGGGYMAAVNCLSRIYNSIGTGLSPTTSGPTTTFSWTHVSVPTYDAIALDTLGYRITACGLRVLNYTELQNRGCRVSLNWVAGATPTFNEMMNAPDSDMLDSASPNFDGESIVWMPYNTPDQDFRAPSATNTADYPVLALCAYAPAEAGLLEDFEVEVVYNLEKVPIPAFYTGMERISVSSPSDVVDAQGTLEAMANTQGVPQQNAEAANKREGFADQLWGFAKSLGGDLLSFAGDAAMGFLGGLLLAADTPAGKAALKAHVLAVASGRPEQSPYYDGAGEACRSRAALTSFITEAHSTFSVHFDAEGKTGIAAAPRSIKLSTDVPMDVALAAVKLHGRSRTQAKPKARASKARATPQRLTAPRRKPKGNNGRPHKAGKAQTRQRRKK